MLDASSTASASGTQGRLTGDATYLTVSSQVFGKTSSLQWARASQASSGTSPAHNASNQDVGTVNDARASAGEIARGDEAGFGKPPITMRKARVRRHAPPSDLLTYRGRAEDDGRQAPTSEYRSSEAAKMELSVPQGDDREAVSAGALDFVFYTAGEGIICERYQVHREFSQERYADGYPAVADLVFGCA